MCSTKYEQVCCLKHHICSDIKMCAYFEIVCGEWFRVYVVGNGYSPEIRDSLEMNE